MKGISLTNVVRVNHRDQPFSKEGVNEIMMKSSKCYIRSRISYRGSTPFLPHDTPLAPKFPKTAEIYRGLLITDEEGRDAIRKRKERQPTNQPTNPLWQVNKYRQQKFANAAERRGKGEGGRRHKFRGI